MTRLAFLGRLVEFGRVEVRAADQLDLILRYAIGEIRILFTSSFKARTH